MSSSNAFERLLTAGLSSAKSDAAFSGTDPRGLMHTLDDESIMLLIQRGDHEALGALFDRYAQLISKVATRILRNSTDAQDLTQEVFLYVHRKSRVFDPNLGSVSSWLVQITYSRAINRCQRRNARAQADCRRIEELSHLAGGVGLALERMTETISMQEVVQHALNDLTEKQRQTLRLYFFEGYSLREISGKTQESFTNTRHHYYRGMERLRAILKDSLGGAVKTRNGSCHQTSEGVA